MKKIVIFLAVLAALPLSACQSIKGVLANRDNGSLDYAHAKKLDPIRLPVGQAAMPFTPLYDVPDSTGKLALTNAQGKQYQLPIPPKVVQ